MSVDDDTRFCSRCGANVAVAQKPGADPYIGRKIRNNFLVLELLGQGGMGKVYKAEQISLGKTVCLKILHQNLMGDPELAKRFHREARAASRLNHPNSISIIDFGEAEDGSLFMAMEFLEGIELGEVIEKEFPLSPVRIGNILGQVCSALGEAHEHQVIHRDLKPENIVIEKRRGSEDMVKVLDFGIAKVLDPKEDEVAGAALTKAGVVCGTPEYMSPEQAKGEALDPRSDIYSLGVILYQMLTADIPFHAPTAMGIVTKHLLEPPVPPSRIRPDVPGPLEAVCMRALKKDRNQRQSSALEFKAEVDAAVDAIKIGAPVAAPPTGLPQAPGVGAAAREHKPGETGEAPFPTMQGHDQPPVTPSPGAAPALTPEAGTPTAPPLTAEEPVAGGGKTKQLIGLGIGAVVAIAAVAAIVMLGGNGGDAGKKPDAGKIADAGKKPDAGKATDAGKKPDAGKIADAGKKPDAGKATDAGKKPDAAKVADAGKKPLKKHGKKSGKRGGRNPKKAKAFYQDGNALFLQGNIDGAIDKYRQAVKANPRLANAHKKLGMCYMRKSQIGPAKAHYKKYLKLRPTAPDANQIKNLVQQLDR